MTLCDRGVTAFSVRPIFFHCGDSGETHLEVYAKLVTREIALQSPPLFAFRVCDEYGRRPDSVEAMEVFRVLFDMDLERDEVVVDECRGLCIVVGLGLQPSACSSGRCRAEVDKQRLVLFLCLPKRLVGVFDPVNGHFNRLQNFLDELRISKEGRGYCMEEVEVAFQIFVAACRSALRSGLPDRGCLLKFAGYACNSRLAAKHCGQACVIQPAKRV